MKMIATSLHTNTISVTSIYQIEIDRRFALTDSHNISSKSRKRIEEIFKRRERSN